MDTNKVCLGKKPGVVKDARTLRFTDFFDRKVLPTAPEQSYVGKSEDVRMYGNDRYGDCTCAAIAHSVDLRERTARQDDIQLETKEVLYVYSKVTGFDPDDPSTDNGAYMLDVLNWVRRYGMGAQADGSPHRLVAFAEIDPKSPREWRLASHLFGGVYWGCNLPLTAADQLDAGNRYWRVDTDAGNRAEPGSWGGHAMHSSGYSEGSIVTTTWDQRLRVTWEFLAEYCDEAYITISEDYLREGGKTREGFDLEQLVNAVEEVTGQ